MLSAELAPPRLTMPRLSVSSHCADISVVVIGCMYGHTEPHCMLEQIVVCIGNTADGATLQSFDKIRRH